MLLERFNAAGFGMHYDFLYLPIDFKNQCNVGYGFINFRTPRHCAEFTAAYNGVAVSDCLPGFNSKKICEVAPGRVQGLNDNVKRLKNSPVMCQLRDHPDWLVVVGRGGGCYFVLCRGNFVQMFSRVPEIFMAPFNIRLAVTLLL